jgi:hypothetical protein
MHKYFFAFLILAATSCFPICDENPLLWDQRCSNQGFNIFFDNNLSREEINLIVKEFNPVVFEEKRESTNEDTIEYFIAIDPKIYKIRQVALRIKRTKGVVSVEPINFDYTVN